jgi:hypothetical protein
VEVGDALNGNREVEKEHEELNSYFMRRVCFYLAAPYASKKNPIDRESDLWQHPWDDKIKRERIRTMPRAELVKIE